MIDAQHQIPPLAVDTKEAARLCGVSERHFITLNEEGLLGPRPVRLKTSVRWVISELTAWLNAGCPTREQWDTLKERLSTAIRPPSTNTQ
jgi:predicted DNA-binding transcriptional regulator AlpA